MALVKFVVTSDIEWYGEGPYPATLVCSKNDAYWNVRVLDSTMAFNLWAVVRVPAHRMDDREPSLDGYYTTTLGKHRKES